MRPAILIVDDSLTVRADLEEGFAEQGMPTIACATLAGARAALAGEAVGLVILDVMLPDGDGIDLLREIRATPERAHLPVLVLSSEAQVRDRIRGMNTGSSDYVGKPYERDYVVARAGELLAGGAAPAASTILVIDDSVTFREQLCESLRAQGYTVTSAASGEEGLRSIGLRRPAAVVVDGALPGIDGAGVVRKLRLDAALRHIPCILLTGSGDDGAELHALDSGADAFVRKDDDLELILARVSAVLRKAGGEGARQPAYNALGAARILAVDDSLSYLHAQADVLRGEGYDVILAESGEEALAMLKAQPVDCILLDRIMPGLGGTETCRRLKADPGTRDIPLIMLTAMEDREAMIEGLSTGADDYVLKSSEFDVLKARVRAQLRRKQFEDESRRIRSELMDKELEAAEARAARALAQSRAELLEILEQKNSDLERAVSTLQESQREIAAKNRQLEEVSRLKSEFLSNMSHELRTPLNAIIGFSELLRGGVAGALAPKQAVCIGHVVNSGKHLLALINDILDLSKVEAGKMTLELDPYQPNLYLQACLDVVIEGAGKRGIGLEFIPCEERGFAMADLRKLKQMVYNLLSNAVKFSADGAPVTLSLHWCAREQVGQHAADGLARRMLPLAASDCPEWLEIRVSDQGAGIREEQLVHLFETFRQLDSSMARNHEGSGLGLALVSRMAALHGGTVSVASAEGRGSQFSIWLPRRSPAPAPGPRGRRVLVIEDDVQASQLLRLHFDDLGFEVQTAGDARAALERVELGRPDLITIDLLLPGISGWDVLSAIKARPQLAQIPVIIISILADEARARALGAARLLQKPIAHRSLSEAVYGLGLGSDSALAPALLTLGEAGADWLAAQLAGFNYRLLRPQPGQDAGAAARQALPDLIIVDIGGQEPAGMDAIDALKADPATAAIALLVLAAPGQQARARLDGKALAIIDQGCDLHQLRQTLHHALQGVPRRMAPPADGRHS